MSTNRTSLLNIVLLGVIIRLWIFYANLDKVFVNRVEVSTPLNSWRRVAEAIYVSNISNDPDPYEGEIIYQPPLYVKVYKAFREQFGDNIYLLFIFFDTLTAFCLNVAAKTYLNNLYKKEKNIHTHTKEISDLFVKEEDILISPVYVTAAYMLNPFVIFSCLGYTTTVFENFFLGLFYVGLVKESIICTAIPLAISIAQSFYPVLLLAPLFVVFKDKSYIKAAVAISLTLILLALVITVSALLNSRWSYLQHTLKFIMTAPELTPNIGLFWYFFIEMFEHFRMLFIYSFQINIVALYVIPLTLRFQKDPVLLTTSLVGLTTIFKSYPNLGEVGLVLSLLPCWKHLQFYMQQGLLIAVSFFMVTLLAPMVWHLWLYSGSANANFYFGATLALATAEIFMITDLLFAYVKREYIIQFGFVKEINEQEAMLLLD